MTLLEACLCSVAITFSIYYIFYAFNFRKQNKLLSLIKNVSPTGPPDTFKTYDIVYDDSKYVVQVTKLNIAPSFKSEKHLNCFYYDVFINEHQACAVYSVSTFVDIKFFGIYNYKNVSSLLKACKDWRDLPCQNM